MRKPISILIGITSITSSAHGVGDLYYNSSLKDTTVLEELEVTAVKTGDRLTVTSPVQELSALNFLTRGVTDISDAMRRLPGVTLRDYGGAGGMKTISVRGLGSQHTGVSYDGIPMSDVQSGQIDLSQFSLDNLSSITLNVGDADEIFTPARTNSMASSLNVKSIGIDDFSKRTPSLTLKIKGGSFGLINPSLKFSLNNRKNLGMNIVGDFNSADNGYGYKLKNGNQVTREHRKNSGIKSGNAGWNGIWKLSSLSTLSANLHTNISYQHLPGPVIYYNTDNNEVLHKTNLFGQVSYNFQPNKIWMLQAKAKYDFGRTHYTDVKSIYPGGVLDRKYLQQEEYFTASAFYRPLSGLSLSYATDYWHNSLSSPTIESPYRNSWLNSISAKWNYRKLTAIFRGLFSLIYDSQKNETQKSHIFRFSPSISISFKPLDSELWSLRGSFKRIMRMPTFNELYYEHYGTINLNPENTTQFNIGTTWRKYTDGVLRSIELKGDGYYNIVSNKIVAVPYNLFLWTMTNLGKVEALGADCSMNIDFALGTQWSLIYNLGYSYQRAATKSEKGAVEWNKQIPYTPLNSGSTSLTLMNPWVNLVLHSVGCSSRYSTTANVPSTRIGGYAEFGLSLFREFTLRNIRLEARGDIANIFDKTYEIVARYPMPGRSFSISLAFHLN